MLRVTMSYLVRTTIMKVLVVTLLTLIASASHITLEDVIDWEKNTAYGYITRIGMPLAEKVRKLEQEASKDTSRIVGGSFAYLGQFPYQAGLLVDFPQRVSLSSAALVSPTRVLTAAHNLDDSVSLAVRVTVVLGSTTIFTGGTRVVTTDFVIHPNWNLVGIRNDVAIVKLPSPVAVTNILAPIALPSGEQLNEVFASDLAVVSGYGYNPSIGGVINPTQPLSFVHMRVITNDECRATFSTVIDSNVCASGEGEIKNICSGDSGGPLAVTRNNKPVLIGITSFGLGVCGTAAPAGFARVTSFMSWINQHL